MDINLEAIGQEKYYEWWTTNPMEDIRIKVIAKDKDKAIKRLGEFLLDLRTKKVNFNKHE